MLYAATEGFQAGLKIAAGYREGLGSYQDFHLCSLARSVRFGLETVRDRAEERRGLDCIKCADRGASGQISQTDSIRKDRGAEESAPNNVVIGSFGEVMSFS